jgi:quercetin 2,3-dioxygenase
MITLRKSNERGTTKIGWLDSKHSFSFGEYFDPKHESFGALRVINEDWIAGGGGVIRPGEIQRMSAGRGIVHSEFNASRDQTAHLLQIWIMPAKQGLEPSYEQKTIAPESVHNTFGRIAAPDPGASEVRLVQDAQIWAAKLDADAQASHHIARGRRAWLQLVSGELVVSGETLQAGDAAAITDADAVEVRALKPSEVLLFDLA